MQYAVSTKAQYDNMLNFLNQYLKPNLLPLKMTSFFKEVNFKFPTNGH